MSNTSNVFIWSGKHTFHLNGSGLKEDTLRIAQKGSKSENLLNLVLPTLCITYADMKFQNSVGGLQSNYPDSRVYGPVYFDPPVEINGEKDIERLTYIRGAQKIVIDPKKTTIEFPSWKELVIPRLRISQKEPIEATIQAKNVPVYVDEPVSILIRQFADGRHIGGINMQMRHPNYVPPKPKQQYNLWVRLLDTSRMKPLVEKHVNIWHFESSGKGPVEQGVFVLDCQRVTDNYGWIQQAGRPSGELEAVTVDLPGWRVTPRCYRPLDGQSVQITLRAWPMQPTTIRYVWHEESSIEDLAALCGHDSTEILKLNDLPNESALHPGMRITLPCYLGTTRLDSWDTPTKMAKQFKFDPKILANLNGLNSLEEYDGCIDLQLPGWHFFHARGNDTLLSIDQLFNLSKGSCIAASKVFRPNPNLLYAGEIVGIPI